MATRMRARRSDDIPTSSGLDVGRPLSEDCERDGMLPGTNGNRMTAIREAATARFIVILRVRQTGKSADGFANCIHGTRAFREAAPDRSKPASDVEDALRQLLNPLLQRVAGNEFTTGFLNRDAKFGNFVITVPGTHFSGVNVQIFQRPLRQRLAERHHHIARLWHARHVLLIVSDRDNQWRLCFKYLPAGVGLTPQLQAVAADFEV